MPLCAWKWISLKAKLTIRLLLRTHWIFCLQMVWWREERHMTFRWLKVSKSMLIWRSRNKMTFPQPARSNNKCRISLVMFQVMKDQEQEINLKLIQWLNKCSWDQNMAINRLLETQIKIKFNQNHKWLLFHTFLLWAQVLLKALNLMLSLNKFHKMRLKWVILKDKKTIAYEDPASRQFKN